MTIGCDRSDDVRVYQVPKTQHDPGPGRTPVEQRAERSGGENDVSAQPDRTPQADLPATPRIDYTVPDRWTEQPGDGMRTAAFSFDGDSGAGQVTLIVLPGQAGGPAANINRWRGQVGLEPLPEQAALESATAITVDGQSGLLVDLAQTEPTDSSARRIIAAIVPHGGSTLFVKMTGPADLLETNRDALKRLLGSLQLTGADEPDSANDTP